MNTLDQKLILLDSMTDNETAIFEEKRKTQPDWNYLNELRKTRIQLREQWENLSAKPKKRD